MGSHEAHVTAPMPPPAANPGNPRQIAAELSSPVAGYITVLPTSVQIWEKYTKL